MRIDRVALLAMALSAAGPVAQAQTCGLMQMGSLDITQLSDNRIVVPGKVNGTTLSFRVDTGGVFSELSDDAVTRLDLGRTQTSKELYSVRGAMHAFSAKADSFMLGQNEAKNFHFLVDAPRPDAAPKPGDQAAAPVNPARIDGLIAPDFLSVFDVEFDFAHEKMNLFSQDHCPGKVVYWTKDYATLPFQPVVNGNTHISFDMTLDGQRLRTVLDTGAMQTVLHYRAAGLHFGLSESSPDMEKLPTAMDGLPSFRRHFEALSFGGLAVKDPSIVILQDKMEDAYRMQHSEKSRDDPVYGSQWEGPELILGMNVLRKLRIYIAYKEHTLYITDADAHQ
jgi:predicted aspartyl protease